MFKFIFPIISVLCVLSLIYGGIFTILEEEKNLCRMTYMFEYPKFVRINFEANKFLPKYGLYAYSEGSLTEHARNMQFSGAPIIFIPGNSGSYKQVRSLASVAIRKGIANGWNQHLDYFTIDLNEEYSGVFGGYLFQQQQFVKASIRSVLNLYKKQQNPPTQVVLIGHSIGGKIAQSILTDPIFAPMINTIISLAGPMDKSVLNVDEHLNTFYDNTHKLLSRNRSASLFDNSLNFCDGIVEKLTTDDIYKPLSLDDTLIITIGGGSRDLYVHSGLTQSVYSDMNVLTTSIPFVWMSTDHLCSVWCLELILVINRFLHSMLEPVKGHYSPKFGQHFIEDKSIRLSKAKQNFVKLPTKVRQKDVIFSGTEEWYEDSRRVYSKIIEPSKSNKTLIHMIRLVDMPQHKHLSVIVQNIEIDDWVFGCAAVEVTSIQRYCSKASTLSLFVKKLPAISNKKSILYLDLHKIKRSNSQWTHVILKFPPSKEKITLHVDIFDPVYRHLRLETPKWYSFTQLIAFEDTLIGTHFYKFEIQGLDESYQSMMFNVKPRGACSSEFHHATAKICIPWMKNCDRYQYFTDSENSPIYVNSPTSKPLGYNTTQNPVSVYLYLDPNCRYKITYQNSFGSTMSRILQQYLKWLPAHLVAILLLAFRHQISITPQKENFKCGKLQIALITAPSFFLITTTRIFSKMLTNMNFFPTDDMNHSILISVVIHGTAYTFILLSTLLCWAAIYFYGNMIHKILLKIIRLPVPRLMDLSVMPIIEKIPITAAILLVSIGMASCGGLALIIGSIIYFMLLTKQYEDYLEEFVFDTATLIAKKIFGKKFVTKFMRKRNVNKEQKGQNDGAAGDEEKVKVRKENTQENTEDKEDEKLEKNNKKRNKKGKKEKQKISTNNKILIDDKKDELLHRNKEQANTGTNDNNEESSKSEDVDYNEPSTSAETRAILDDAKKKQISDRSEILLKAFEESSLDENQFPENLTDEELDKLLADAISKQAKSLNERKEKEALERIEYDSVHEAFSSINFHMTLFLLLCILTILNLPSTVSWARNFSYSPRLTPDPSFLPASVCLICISILWQFSAPRNIRFYSILSAVLYIFGAFSILYCQDSIYRLNYLIACVFSLITIMQIIVPKKVICNDSNDIDVDLQNKINKIKTLLKEDDQSEEKM